MVFVAYGVGRRNKRHEMDTFACGLVPGKCVADSSIGVNDIDRWRTCFAGRCWTGTLEVLVFGRSVLSLAIEYSDCKHVKSKPLTFEGQDPTGCLIKGGDRYSSIIQLSTKNEISQGGVDDRMIGPSIQITLSSFSFRR